jgi:hypothetical protein
MTNGIPGISKNAQRDLLSTEIDHQTSVKRCGNLLQCCEGHIRMIQAFDARNELLFGSQTPGQIGLREPFLSSEFRDSQGQPGRKIFGVVGLLKIGILEVFFQTISEQSSFHEPSSSSSRSREPVRAAPLRPVDRIRWNLLRLLQKTAGNHNRFPLNKIEQPAFMVAE